MMRGTRGPSRRRDDRGRAVWRAGADQDEPPAERVHAVRWSRIWVGLFLLAAGIIWLVINNALGLYSSPGAQVSAPASATIPALGAAQRDVPLTVTAKLVGYYPSVAGRSAPAGTRFVVIAARVVNRGATPIVIRPAQFALRAAGATLAGAAVPGQPYTLFARPVPSGATADGYLLFAPSSEQRAWTLTYTPAGAQGARTLSWRVG